jgi:hypothetical protein
MARRFSTITVRDLMEALEGQDPEALVIFASDYGDHCHTQQAFALDGDLEEVQLEESAYSDSGWAVAGERDDFDEPLSEQTYLRLS